MNRFIPYEKLSKKKKRELDARRRNVWTISPVTRKPENPKAYNRRKTQKPYDEPDFCVFFFYLMPCGAEAPPRTRASAWRAERPSSS